MREAELRDGVDRLGLGDALHEGVRRLVDERHEDAIRDETGKVVRLGGGLAEILRERDDRGRRLVGGLQRADHLDELQHGHRVEEVHPDDLLWATGDAGERRDRDRRRVRREDRLGWKDLVCAPEDRLLHCRVLDDGLDEEVGGDDVGGKRHARQDILGCDASLLGQLRQALLHRSQRPLGGPRQLVVERNAPAGGRHDLRDAAAHLARTDHQDVLEPHAPSLGG